MMTMTMMVMMTMPMWQAGMNKLARENCRNDGPMGGGFIPPDTLKVGTVSIQYVPKILGS